MAEEREAKDQELFKLEYQECASHSRFTVGHRFTYFISFATIFFVLIGAYNYVWITEVKALGQLKSLFLLLISIFGLITVWVAWMIEWRCIQIYRTCDNRAAAVERLMGIGGGGIWQVLTDQGRRKKFLGIPIGHVAAISLFYGAVLSTWLLLVMVSGYLFLFSE